MANPVLNDRILQGEVLLDSEPMTVSGAINKTFILLMFLLAGSFATWGLFMQGATDKFMALTVFGFVASIIAFIVIMFNKKVVKYMAPVYAACEGLILGGTSAILEKVYPGIAIQAIAGTMICLAVMLLMFKSGMIKCTEKFRSTIFVATASICVLYLVNFIGHFFHMQIPYIFASGSIGIGFSVLVVFIAALNLIIDFDFIEKCANSLMPKDMEWYGAFGLMVTLVWLYIEILNLLAKMRDR